MMRSRSSLIRLYNICTTPINSVTRNHHLILNTPYTAIVPAGISSCECYFRPSIEHRGLSQKAAVTKDDAPDIKSNVSASGIPVAITTSRGADHNDLLQPKGEIKSACGDVKDGDEEEFMEQEEMYVEAHESFDHTKKEWGGPRRGGRLPEPTRFGDWERKGRCSDF